jgi:hypothetical protein
MDTILRYYIKSELAEERLPELVDYCRRVKCRHILLFTSRYDEDVSFLPLNEIQTYVDRMQDWATRLRSEGIDVSVNVLQTMGHVFYPKTDVLELRFQRRVNLDGAESTAGACPLCSRLTDYLKKAYQIYATLKPVMLFVDDDFRGIMGEGLTCFCPQHIQKVSQQLGRNVELDEVREVFQQEGFTHENPVRLAVSEVQRAAWVNLAREIHRAVTPISPETRIGFMGANFPVGNFGMDWKQVAEALAGTHRPLFRPQICNYNDHLDLHQLPQLLHNPLIIRKAFGDSIEYCPEIENYTYTSWVKSVQMTIEDMSWCYLYGFDRLLLNIFDMFNSPLDENTDLIAAMESHQEWFRVLRQIGQETIASLGIAMPVSPSLCEVRRGPISLEKGFFDWNTFDLWLPLLGLPIGYEWETSPWVLLQGDSVLAWTDDQIRQLLKRGVIMDREAAQCLIHRGFGSDIGMDIGELLPPDFCGMEYFKDEAYCGSFAGRYQPMRAFCGTPKFRKMIPLSSQWKTVSSLLNPTGQEVTPMVAVRETPDGTRMGFLNFTSQDPWPVFCHNRRQTQIRLVAQWIARKPLPVAVLDHPNVYPIRLQGKGRDILAIFNVGYDDIHDVSLQWAKSPGSREWMELQRDGIWSPASITECECAPELSTLKLNKEIRPLHLYLYSKQNSI